MIAGNYSNNFQYVPEWLWDRHISPTEFFLYTALRSFSYPTGPTIEMLAAKTGFDSAVVEDTVRSLHAAGLAEPCLADEYANRATTVGSSHISSTPKTPRIGPRCRPPMT